MSQPRLNGFIRAWEEGRTAISCFAKVDILVAEQLSGSPYDGVVFEMEHNPYDAAGLGNALQYMLDRRAIAMTGSIAPSVTPIARIPANGAEMNQFLAKQVLDRGVYGIIAPHIATVEQAYNTVAACRYPRPGNAPLYEPKGVRGDGPASAARYWGLTQAEYYQRADVWPLAPHGELVVGLMVESLEAIENLADILANVPGIGFCLVGQGDLSQALGYPRQYEHPEVAGQINRIVEICRTYSVIVGNPHVDERNVERLRAQGYRLLMTAPTQSYGIAGSGGVIAGY
ncbi:HpcH/HpaI aldolase family protein [Novosphingobium mathurense]|uniref:4-hydroxy-2-oxoheptanedioate aldolase n=1 Tax=Novosphingobium mathurense TaxID=428990 RepID=A0A1U6ILU2_9SPHN|nr:aldolase/citrate lyase family protein [Novosphingobium mathurense]SLK08998.1 4-hydroxy-2-oxoheptanedioate aldolase [Novosphingobium mathurense]